MLIHSKNKGQSTIEFIVTFVFAIGFTFSFFKIASIYTNGYLVHYATYMAGRAYMVFDNNSNNPAGSDNGASLLAKKVFEGFKLGGLLGGTIEELELNDPESYNNYSNNLYVGAWFGFQASIADASFGFWKDFGVKIGIFFR